MKRLFFIASLVMLAAFGAAAQNIDSEKCPGHIYNRDEVTRRARIVRRADLRVIHENLPRDVQGRVIVEAILCRTGRVTDIRVIQGLSPTINEFIAAAVSLVSFTPAEVRWHSVSQRIRFEFGFNDSGRKEISPADAKGRIVEYLEIIGYRSLTNKQILSWIRTKPGEQYSFEKVNQDLQSILATGYFDRKQTRVITEDGVRGGAGVIFEVVELPLIEEVRFEGLKVDRSRLMDALKKDHIDLQPGVPFDADTTKDAVRVIKRVLAASGHSDSTVEIQIEQLSGTRVKVIFMITSK